VSARDFVLCRETSERSDAENWTRQAIEEDRRFALVAFEGCNQDASHRTTHLLGRSVFCRTGPGPVRASDIAREIVRAEGPAVLADRRLCAERVGVPYEHVVYSYHAKWVSRFAVGDGDAEVQIVQRYPAVGEFGGWLQEIKGWRSDKPFRERPDLPWLDRELRKLGTPWPTNIDGFLLRDGHPAAVLEFQNADRTTVERHCNNDYFTQDRRRWRSLDILRREADLPLVVVTWERGSHAARVKEVVEVRLNDDRGLRYGVDERVEGGVRMLDVLDALTA
jgi:hypothetical protein